MIVYRIIRDAFKNDPLSVEGSKRIGARWHPKGMGVLYTTQTPELGLIEVLAHMPSVRLENLPSYWLFSIEIPDDVTFYSREKMPDFWQDETYERTETWALDWLTHPTTLGLGVPSVLVTLSHNILLHPGHKLFKEIKLINTEIQPIDKRLWHPTHDTPVFTPPN